MSRKIINVGSEPGNGGDGDTLRDAFVKTNANFEDLFLVHYVTDTSLNHDDPAVEGTIAYALAEADAAGGGTVLVGRGMFTCPSTTLTVPESVILKGVGRNATVINVTGSQVGITVSGRFSGVESLRLRMPRTSSGDGIKITKNYVTLKNLKLTGLDTLSWGINVDGANTTALDNILLGSAFSPFNDSSFTGNGIIFQNTNQVSKPWNFGESHLSSIAIKLALNNTTVIKFHGPDGTGNVINDILLSRVEIMGQPGTGIGITGVHLRNAKRIVFNTVDLEELEVAIFEEGAGGNSKGTDNNIYIGVFVFAATTSYLSSGMVGKRLFLGCANLKPDFAANTDVIIPAALWVNDGGARISQKNPNGITFDEGDSRAGVEFRFNTDNPSIRPGSNIDTARLTLGAAGTRGVECVPGLILPLQLNAIPSAVDGTTAQFAAGVVGTDRGIYQLRDGSWIFIG
ncbi:MAG: hypothetical protein ACC707_13285 [Thiohalomonadales bacterium]